MGTILRAACSRCAYHTELFVGGGRGDCNPEAAIAAMQGDVKVVAALNNNAWFQIERIAAICRNCRKLTVFVRVDYQEANASKQSKHNVCPDCSGVLMPIAPDVQRVPCPVCKGTVHLEPVGKWD